METGDGGKRTQPPPEEVTLQPEWRRRSGKPEDVVLQPEWRRPRPSPEPRQQEQQPEPEWRRSTPTPTTTVWEPEWRRSRRSSSNQKPLGSSSGGGVERVRDLNDSWRRAPSSASAPGMFRQFSIQTHAFLFYLAYMNTRILE